MICPIKTDHILKCKVHQSIRFWKLNFTITGTKGPFEEDNWLYIRIGDCLFRNSALCGRCIFTTVDPKTGEKHADGQPLKTLKKFRQAILL